MLNLAQLLAQANPEKAAGAKPARQPCPTCGRLPGGRHEDPESRRGRVRAAITSYNRPLTVREISEITGVPTEELYGLLQQLKKRGDIAIDTTIRDGSATMNRWKAVRP